MTTRVDYDYNDLRQRISDRLAEKEGWGDAIESTVGQTLIDIGADAADHLSYMLERRSQESYLTTARLQSSVYTRSSELGYRPRRFVSSTGTIRIELTGSEGDLKPVEPTGQIIIPENTVLTFSQQQFLTTKELIIEEGVSSIDVVAIEGVRETITINPVTDTVFQNFNFILFKEFIDIEENSIRVTSGGFEYKDIQSVALDENLGSLSFADQTGENSRFYDIRYSHEGMRIQFGDGMFGRLPTQPITVSYIRSKGRDVQVVSTDNEFEFETYQITDNIPVVPANEYIPVIKNISPIVGGRAAESLAEVRLNAPVFNSAGGRAVGIGGYTFWARRSNIGNIVDARAFSEKELDTLMFNLNNIYVTYLKADGQELTIDEKDRFVEFMKKRDVALAHIIPKQANEITLRINAAVKRARELPIPSSDLYTLLRDFLINTFKRRAGSIGIEHQKSDIIRSFYDLQERIDGVTYNVVDFVDLSIRAVQYISIPEVTSSATVYLDRDIDPADFSVGDVLSIKISETPVSVTVEASDFTGEFYSNMLLKLRDAIITETSTAVVIADFREGIIDIPYLIVRVPDGFGTFVIEKNGGEFEPHIIIAEQIAITPPSIAIDAEADSIMRGSFELKSMDDEVLFRDNGMGYWIDVSDGTLIDASPISNRVEENGVPFIDYTRSTAILPPSIASGDYFIEYQQDEFQNFRSNEAATVTYIAPKLELADAEDTLSIIRLI